MANKKLNKIYDEIIEMSLPMVRDFKIEDFNSYIAVGFLPGAPIEKMIGRIVQFREESGAFGSNQIFIRCADGKLQCHENQWFYRIPEEFIPQLEKLFEEVGMDEPNRTYSIGDKYKRKGFFIKSKIKKGETTPMREVRKEIAYHLSKL